VELAYRGALEVPWEVMRTAQAAFPLLRAMAEQGNKASASDAGVGALCVRAAVRGAWLNVRTNTGGIRDVAALAPILEEGPASNGTRPNRRRRSWRSWRAAPLVVSPLGRSDRAPSALGGRRRIGVPAPRPPPYTRFGSPVLRALAEIPNLGRRRRGSP